MDEQLSTLLSIQVIVFCVIIAVSVQVLRHIVEWIAGRLFHKFPSKYELWLIWLWRENLLPMLPLVIGGAISYFIDEYPYPEVFTGSVSARVFFGIFAGIISNTIYPRVKYYYKQFLPKKLDETVIANTGVQPPTENQ